jgi:hypothetical protein
MASTRGKVTEMTLGVAGFVDHVLVQDIQQMGAARRRVRPPSRWTSGYSLAWNTDGGRELFQKPLGRIGTLFLD